MLLLGTLLKYSSWKLGYACIIHDHMALRYTDFRLYPEPFQFSFILFHYLSPVLLTPFALSFSSEMVILIYSLYFSRLWDILFSLWCMCFECTLLFKLFIRFIHLLYVWVFWLHVYLFAMWVLGAKGDQKRALWMVVNQHGREGIGVGPASVCIIGKLLFTFHQNRKHKNCCHSACFLLFLFVFPTRSHLWDAAPNMHGTFSSLCQPSLETPSHAHPNMMMPSLFLNLIKLTMKINHHTWGHHSGNILTQHLCWWCVNKPNVLSVIQE